MSGCHYGAKAITLRFLILGTTAVSVLVITILMANVLNVSYDAPSVVEFVSVGGVSVSVCGV